MVKYKLTLAGISFICDFKYEGTAELLGGEIYTGHMTDEMPVRISNSEWRYWHKNYNKYGAEAEANLMSLYVSSALLSHQRGLFHAAAFSIKGKAWLISAPPGTGKSTQMKTLCELYPGEISIICGDRPALELKNDGTVMVHPSPWNGKEQWGGTESAPLAGIILLFRSSKNVLKPLPCQRAIIPVYTSLLKIGDTTEDIKAAAGFTDELLKRTNFWYFENGGVPDSTKLLYEKLLSQEF